MLNSGASDLAVVKDLESLETVTRGDVGEAFVSDLHTTVELQHGQVVSDCVAGTQAAYTLVCDPTAVRHALCNNKLKYTKLLSLSLVFCKMTC